MNDKEKYDIILSKGNDLIVKGEVQWLNINLQMFLKKDMDLLIIEEMISSKEFLQLFLSRVGIADAEVLSAEHSKMDISLGESDITVILKSDDCKFAVLIEDKIDAEAMPEQSGRYHKRGEKGIENGEYEKYFVFITAPQMYLETNEEAAKYPNKISFEEILNYFEKRQDERSRFKTALIKMAIDKRKNGYIPIEHQGVMDFWKKYVAYKETNYPELLLVSSAGKKGSAATWPRYNTKIHGLYILHKSEFGFVDLTFESTKDKILKIDELIKQTFGSYEAIGASINITNKSVH